MAKLEVLVTRRWPRSVEEVLAGEFNATLNRNDEPLAKAELAEAIKNYDAILTTVTDRIDADLLNGKAKVRLLGNFGVGFNHIDIAAAKTRGIVVTNTPDVLTDCTADLAMTLILMVARRAGEGEREVRAKTWTGWRPTHLLGRKVTGKTLGIIGMGRIGEAVARRAHYGFGMPILYHSRNPKNTPSLSDMAARHCASLEELLAEADFVSLHCPATPETRHLIDAKALSAMKQSAYLINTARGDVVDEDALIAALKAERIAGAGIDVFQGEPKLNPRFLELENAVLLPHLGSATEETRAQMGMRVVTNLRAFAKGEAPPDRIA